MKRTTVTLNPEHFSEPKQRRYPSFRTPPPVPSAFAEILEKSKAMDEKDDCAVKAAAILTGIDYNVVHSVFENRGREHRSYTPYEIIRSSYNDLGCDLIPFTHHEMDALRPKGHRFITTYQPVRYPEIWSHISNQNLLLRSRGHDTAWQDGRIQCWSRGRSLRIKEIFRVVVI